MMFTCVLELYAGRSYQYKCS